jgi:hypothetical protein
MVPVRALSEEVSASILFSSEERRSSRVSDSLLITRSLGRASGTSSRWKPSSPSLGAGGDCRKGWEDLAYACDAAAGGVNGGGAGILSADGVYAPDESLSKASKARSALTESSVLRGGVSAARGGGLFVPGDAARSLGKGEEIGSAGGFS